MLPLADILTFTTQSTMAGQHLMEYLKDLASFHDEGVRKTFEATVTKHDNEQLASALIDELFACRNC